MFDDEGEDQQGVLNEINKVKMGEDDDSLDFS